MTECQIGWLVELYITYFRPEEVNAGVSHVLVGRIGVLPQKLKHKIFCQRKDSMGLVLMLSAHCRHYDVQVAAVHSCSIRRLLNFGRQVSASNVVLVLVTGAEPV